MKRLLWAAWLAGAGALHLFGNNAGTFAVLAAAAALPVVSVLALMAAAKRLRLSPVLSLPHACITGEAMEGQLVLHGRPRVFRVSCRLICENLMTGERSTLRLDTDRFILQPQFCGDLLVLAEGFTLNDPLGLFAKSLNCAARRVILVRRDGFRSDLRDAIDAVSDNDEYSMTRAGSDPSEIYAIREYIPGDPIRSIHWKLTEKLDKVMVREFGRPLARHITPAIASAPDSQTPATQGLCLCRAVRPAGGIRLAPLLTAAALFVGMTGALWRMLALTVPSAFAFAGPQAIPGCFKLLANRMFSVSEQYQAYRYHMFAVDILPERYESCVFTAFLLVSAGLAVYIFLMLKSKSIVMCLCLWGLLTGVQIYFGVFPSAGWTIICYAALAALILSAPRKDLSGGHAAVIVVTLAISIPAWFVFPGPHASLTALSETIRDQFDEKFERPVAMLLNPPDTAHDARMADMPLRTQMGADKQPGGEAYRTEREERFSGSQIGAAAAKRLWVLWLILLLFIAGFAVWAGFRLRADAKRKAVFDAPDGSAAIDGMFRYLTRWLWEYGLEARHAAYCEYAARLETMISARYAADYRAAVLLWQKAVYSAHEMTNDERAHMRSFMDDTIRMIRKRTNPVTRTRIRLRLFFS